MCRGTDYVANTLLRKIREVEAEKLKLQRDKANLENTLEAEQEYISNRLSKQVCEAWLLNRRVPWACGSPVRSLCSLPAVCMPARHWLATVPILCPPHRALLQLEQLAMEKNTMMTEKLELRRQVNELAASVDKLNREKVALEAQVRWVGGAHGSRGSRARRWRVGW